MPKHKTVKLTCTGIPTQFLAYVGYEREKGFRWSPRPVCTTGELARLQAFYERNSIVPEPGMEIVDVTNGCYCPNDGLLPHKSF